MKLLILVLFSCSSQINKREKSKTLFEIIFADGFKSDEIIFYLNGKEISKSILNSNKVDGLTSLEYKIIEKKNDVILINMYKDDNVNHIEDKQKIELSVMYKKNMYNYLINANQELNIRVINAAASLP